MIKTHKSAATRPDYLAPLKQPTSQIRTLKTHATQINTTNRGG